MNITITLTEQNVKSIRNAICRTFTKWYFYDDKDIIELYVKYCLRELNKGTHEH